MKLPNNHIGAGLRPFVILIGLTPIIFAVFSAIIGTSLASIPTALFALIMGLDTLMKVLDYEVLSMNRGYMARNQILHRFRDTHCGRGVAIALYQDVARSYYEERGYRWYHIFPEGAPWCWFTVKFWGTILGFKSRVPELEE